MVDITFGAPAHPCGLNQRPHAASQLLNPRQFLHDQQCCTPGVIPTLVAQPESHSP